MKENNVCRRVGLYTLGCKVSQYETEAVAERFEELGYEVVDFFSPADVYVINTCTVTAESDAKSRKIIRRAKKQSPSAKVLVCGCYTQRSPEEVLAMPEVNAVIGSAGKLSLPDLAERLLSGEDKILSVTDIHKEAFEPMCIKRSPRTRAYVKIEDGCESRCAYCAIPSARGRVRSKPMEDVISEVEALSASGVAEIVLTGIETGSYGVDLGMKNGLAELLAVLDERKSAGRIRLGSLAPELVGREFAERVAALKCLAPHFHISIQSGSDNVLRGMRRRYTRRTALENIRYLKKLIPNATFTTDLMVGFPGEGEEDFLDTVSFAREAGFIDCHVFAYSGRRGTPAVSMPGQVPPEVKKDRSERLIAAVKEISAEAVEAHVRERKTLSVVVESRSGDNLLSHSDSYVEVVIEGESTDEACGKICDVMITRTEGNKAFGKLIL